MGNQPGKLQHQNQSGRPKKMVHWKSAERPSPPGRPVLVPLSDQQPDVVSLRWERPKLDGGSPITGYIVEHRRMGSPHWVRATPTPVAQCEVAISGLEPGWRYQFRAIAENVVGRSDPSELSDPLTVTLQRNAISVPRFIDELQDTNAVEDERIEFRVRVLGQPPPEINWFKDGYEVFSSRRTKILNDNDVSVLIIHQVALTDEGEIKCTATNRAGHVVTKSHLLVQAPPKIRLPRAYEDGLIVEADEVLRLKVGVAGQPPPTVTWLHEGEVVPNTGRFEIVNTDRNSLLKIDNVHRDDRGEYSIRASNRLGDDLTSFLVTVTARPNPPGRVRLNMSFGKSATLSWTAPIDDGGCKIGNYIVEYFRIGWNVWLKAATTRSLSITLHDLIEGSEYKFRVKAENPYGLSDPSEESDVLFIPDPKRGINKPKSETRLTEEKTKPTAPQRKTLSPQRPHQDAATETKRIIPAPKPKPQLIDNEDLHREMSYGTSDHALKMDVRKSPSMSSADSATQGTKLNLSIETPAPKSPQRSPATTPKVMKPFTSKKDQASSPLPPKSQKMAPPESPTKNVKPPAATLHRKRSLSPVKPASDVRKPSPIRRSPTPPEPINTTPALQRSAEPVQLDVNQHVRRFSGHSLSPAKNAPSLAIAIATASFGAIAGQDNAAHDNVKSKENGKQNASTLTNPTIQISAPPATTPTLPFTSVKAPLTPITEPSSPSVVETPTPSTAGMSPLYNADRLDDVHTSNEFMLVVFDKNSKVKDKDKQDSFELELEEALQPPPISISSPDLASLEYNNLHIFPLRRSVSSTELLYERAMARFYEAVELEEAEKARKSKISQDKIATPSNVQPTTIRKRLGSMTEAERLSFERRSEMRRQSADLELKSAGPMRWGSRENVSTLKPLSRTVGMLVHDRQLSQESEDLSDYQPRRAPRKQESYEEDLGSDYTESTASSDMDSIEKFKMELLARTRTPSPPELETYHPRNMSAGVFTPYRAPTPEQAAIVLTRPVPLPDPDFVPKPILKRQSNENVQQAETNAKTNHNTNNNNNDNTNSPPKSRSADSGDNPGTNGNDKMNIAKGISSFFKRDKRSATEKNTEGNEVVANLTAEMSPAQKREAEAELKRKSKEEEEERKRREAERIMQEEAHAAADHYGDLVSTVSSTRKYKPPIYLDKEGLKRVAEKAAQEGITDDDDNMSEQMKMRRSVSPDRSLIPPMSNKPRLSISERGQLVHVRETASDAAVTQKVNVPDTPSEESSAPQFSEPVEPSEASEPSEPSFITSTVVSETLVERPDSRGRTRLVKVKRIIKKRMPSGTRSRDTSTSRPPSSAASVHEIGIDMSAAENATSPVRRRVLSRTRVATNESRSPGPLGRKPLSTDVDVAKRDLVLFLANKETAEKNEVKSAEQMTEEAQEKVRSALSYSTDLVLFVVACYVYLFKAPIWVLPILALMIYRQLGEWINDCIPNWMKRKKN